MKNPILVVDDDEVVLFSIKETLLSLNYEVESTQSAQKAIKLVKEKDFSAIISDQRMSDMTGIEFLTKVKAIKPSLPLILITGVLTPEVMLNAINKVGVLRLLAKPWKKEELQEVIESAREFNLKQGLVDNLLALNHRISSEKQALKTLLLKNNIDC